MPINGNTFKIIKVPNYSKVYPTLWCFVSSGHARSLSLALDITLPGVWPWWLPESRWNCRQPWRPDACWWHRSMYREKLQIRTGWWFQPLWKIWKSVGIIIPYMGKKHVPNHQPENHWKPQFMCCTPCFEAIRWKKVKCRTFEHHPTIGNTISPNKSQGLNTVSDTHIRPYKGSYICINPK